LFDRNISHVQYTDETRETLYWVFASHSIELRIIEWYHRILVFDLHFLQVMSRLVQLPTLSQTRPALAILSRDDVR
jgi:hypothetical protein